MNMRRKLNIFLRGSFFSYTITLVIATSSEICRLPELKSVALPIVIEFSKDEDESVREANLETLVSLLNLFDDGIRKMILFSACFAN